MTNPLSPSEMCAVELVRRGPQEAGKLAVGKLLHFDSDKFVCQVREVDEHVGILQEEGTYQFVIGEAEEEPSSALKDEFLWFTDDNFLPYGVSSDTRPSTSGGLLLPEVRPGLSLFKLPPESISVEAIVNDAVRADPKSIQTSLDELTAALVDQHRITGFTPADLKLDQVIVSRETGEMKLLPVVRLVTLEGEAFARIKQLDRDLKSEAKQRAQNMRQIIELLPFDLGELDAHSVNNNGGANL